jgi:CubicO group peptidase (beta-lactamase class C family)
MTSLPRSTPAEQGVDPGALLALLDALAARPEVEMHSLMVLRHGHVVAEGWWAPYRPDHRPLLYSLSKAFTSTATAFAQAEGLLHLDDPVLQHFPEHASEVTDARTRSTTLRHLITMASGHTRDMLGEAVAADPADPVRGFLLLPPEEEPGSVFAYNQPCTHTLACVIQRTAGMSLVDYLRPRLLDPLGIGPVGWHTMPPGHQMGFSGLHARTEDVAKLGQLHLQRGRWHDRQLLPAEWVAEATRKHVDNAGQQPGKPDWEQGYGYQFWMARHGYRGDGAFGQFCVVLPDHDVVVATTGGTDEMQTVLDMFWDHLLPGLDRDGIDVDRVQAVLTGRLSALTLEPRGGGTGPEEPVAWGGRRWEVTAGGGLSTTVTSIELDRTEERWGLVLVEADDRLVVPFAPGRWLSSRPTTSRDGLDVPVAASGGWEDGTLRVEVLMLENAHRMDVDITPESATATWRAPPLGDPPLRRMRCPG